MHSGWARHANDAAKYASKDATGIFHFPGIGPDAAGKCNTGLGIECLNEMVAGARLVIAQVNPLLPWTAGDTRIAPGRIDILVPAAHPVKSHTP